MSFAVLFPGQGSQKVGMGLDLYEKSNLTKKLFSKVNQITGQDLTELIFHGPETELNQTENTQVAILILSMALTLELEEICKTKKLKFNVQATAGHSLGEFTALWYASMLNTDEVINIILKRGKIMQNAPPGAMAAVLNLEPNIIQNIIEENNLKQKVVIANYNSPSQHVISGTKEEVIKLSEKIKLANGKAIILPVSGAFHSPLMQNSACQFEIELKKLHILSKSQIKIPVYQNIDGMPSQESKLVLEKIKKQMTSPVLWTQTISNLVKNGIKTVVEIGPGKVLTGLVKKTNPQIECFNINDYNSLEEFTTIYERRLLSTQS